MNKPYGLTGNIACGKSTVAEILRDNGIIVYDCDLIARAITEDRAHRDQLIEILNVDTWFDLNNKRAIAKIIFSNADIKKNLENYVHSLVWENICLKIASLRNNAIVFVESAILYEIGWVSRFEGIVVATCSEEEQQRRLREERGMSCDEIDQRLASQMPYGQKESRADMVISTEGSRDSLKREVEILCVKLKQANQ